MRYDEDNIFAFRAVHLDRKAEISISSHLVRVQQSSELTRQSRISVALNEIPGQVITGSSEAAKAARLLHLWACLALQLTVENLYDLVLALVLVPVPDMVSKTIEP